MPFTLAHPAVVLPLARRPFVGLALAAGAMAPDVPYYVRATGLPVTAESWYEPFVNATTTHSAAALPTVDLVLSAVLWVVLVVSVPALAALVLGWPDVRLPRPRPGSVLGVVAAAAWTVVSLLLGAASHLLWDALTHGGPATVRLASLPDDPVLGGVSTVVGLLVVGGYLLRLWRRRPADRRAPDRRRVLAVLGVVLVVGLAGAVAATSSWWGGSDQPTSAVVQGIAYDVAIGGVLAVAALAAVAVLAWWASRLIRR